MHLDRDLWYVRWFFWSLGIWDAFMDNGDTTWRVETRGINLCPFVRIMLLYAPLVIVLHAVVYVAAFMAFTVIPIRLFGWSNYLWAFGVVIVFTLVAVVSIRKLNDWSAAQTAAYVPKIKKVSAFSDPSFFTVLRQWLAALHKKICPIITFVTSQKKEG